MELRWGQALSLPAILAQKMWKTCRRRFTLRLPLRLVASVVLTIVGVLLAPQMLIWMDTPSNVLPSSITYFRIYFAGSLGLVMYNIFVGILQAIGDSKHPLYYLIISSITNIVLDIVFISVFHFGVGAAVLRPSYLSF